MGKLLSIMNKTFLLIAAGIFGLLHSAHAQDPTFTQYWANPIYLNPAFAGVNGVTRVSMNHRNQWNYVPGQYVTSSASIDMKTCNWNNIGIGLLAWRDTEGEGLLNTSAASFVFNYMIQNEGKYQVSFGLQPTLTNKTLDWERLVFSDQLDPVFGVNRPSAGEAPAIDSRSFFDFSAGIMWRFFTRTKNRDDLYSNVGLAVNHIMQPNESILGEDSKLPLRLTAHAGTVIPISNYRAQKKIALVPHAKLEFQRFDNVGLKNTISEFDAGFYIMREPVLFGLNYQSNTNFNFKNGKAVSVVAGLKGVFSNSFNYMISYSYDINVAGLSRSNVGTHEIGLTLMFDEVCFIGFGGKNGPGGSKEPRKCFDYKKKGIIPIF
ncbi:MAG: PorP/SprF family type IX secretion system membrane protein [Bacteroidia bacterium]